MKDWFDETDCFLSCDRRNVPEGKVDFHMMLLKEFGGTYEKFRKKQQADYISDFDK